MRKRIFNTESCEHLNLIVVGELPKGTQVSKMLILKKPVNIYKCVDCGKKFINKEEIVKASENNETLDLKGFNKRLKTKEDEICL